MKAKFCLILLLLSLLSVQAFCQLPAAAADTNHYVSWTHGIALGISILPIGKERLRLAYHWEARPNLHLVHGISLVYMPEFASRNPEDAVESYGDLSGFALTQELRKYRTPKEGSRTNWYHGISLSYMYTDHELTKGFECDEWGSCAYFRRFPEAVAHTTTLMGAFGMVLSSKSYLQLDFFTGLGLRGTYFPEIRSRGYFGASSQLAESESFVLQPHIRLGVNMFFRLNRRMK